MNIVKVFDINGKHVDSFRKLQKKRAIYGRQYSRTVRQDFGRLVRFLNEHKFFIRRQLKDTKAALGNVGLFSTSKLSSSLRSMFK